MEHSHFDPGLVSRVLLGQLLVLDLQVRDGDFQLLVDLQPTVVYVAQNRRLLRQVLKMVKDTFISEL